MVKSFEIFLVLNIRTRLPFLVLISGVYVLKQFPSIVMLGMKGFHISASGAIQGRHGPLVLKCSALLQIRDPFINDILQILKNSNVLIPKNENDYHIFLLHVILDCDPEFFPDSKTYKSIIPQLESISRGLCWSLYHKRQYIMSRMK